MITSATSLGAICDQSMEVKALATAASRAIENVATTKATKVQCASIDNNVSGGAGVEKSSLPHSLQNNA